jgi:hypothetical protein
MPKKATTRTATVYKAHAAGASATTTTVRVRKDGVVYKQDRKKFEAAAGANKPPPQSIPEAHRVKSQSPDKE